MLYIDLETRSDVDLIFHGLTRYAQDLSTQVICMAWAFDDEPVEFWWGVGGEFPARVRDHIKEGGLLMAHNAEFERALFEFVINNDYRIAPARLAQWRCSMAIGLVNGYAGGLDALAKGLGLPISKHAEGTRLIREFCGPGHMDIFAPEHAHDREIMKEYNISDVEVMRAATKCLRDLSEGEWEEYHLNCRINDRGLPIDVKLCEAALQYTHTGAADANRAVCELTGGGMKKTTERKSRDEWLLPKLTVHQIKALEVHKKGEKKISLDAGHRRYLLECDDLDVAARKLLEYIDNAGSSALKKYAVAAHQHVDGRVHNTFLWNGAGRTGRFSGKGLQPHNIRRDVYSEGDAQSLINNILSGVELERPAEVLGRLLRSLIHHPAGLYWVDWSAIEGRVAPWLAASISGEKKLEVFRQGFDVYKYTAARMFMCERAAVTPEHRQVGKIAELALQFGGGVGALMRMAANYGLQMGTKEAEPHVKSWRTANPWAQDIWDEYNSAITEAVRVPGRPVMVGRVTYESDGENFLWCKLPSGRLLAYPKPKYEEYDPPWGGEPCFGVTFQTHFKPAAGAPPLRNHLRGALGFQNTVQAVAADMLREALLCADDDNLNIVGHVHDEIIGLGSPEAGARLNAIMLEQPEWAPGLPIATGGVSYGTRYGK